jgi:hypothetical protein
MHKEGVVSLDYNRGYNQKAQAQNPDPKPRELNPEP